MQTSVNLQEPFTYSLILLFFLIFLIIIFTVYIVYLRRKANTLINKKTEIKEIPEKNIKNIPVIKEKYLKQLDSIDYKYENEMIDLRKAYQLISEAIRLFVFEITDITTQNYSLSEIKKIKIPELYELIEEYYEPEFKKKPIGDFKSSINKARRIIDEWK